MKDNLQNNREALESLFDDEFYHMVPKAMKSKSDTEQKESIQPNESQSITPPESNKMSNPCMVFTPGNDPSNQRDVLDLWRKILAAVQLTPNKVSIVEFQPGISFDNILEGKMGTPIIFWTGEDKIEELEGFTSYEIHENEDVAFVIADPLPVISKSRDLKLKLWAVLQKMKFNTGE